MAHNKFLAKLASDLEKPDGLVCVDPLRVQSFLDPMPIKRLWGIGPKTAPRLQALGILTFGQLRQSSPAILQPVLGNRTDHFLQLARGEDERPVVAESADKSISHEQTFDQDLLTDEDMHAELQRLSEAVAQRLRRRGLRARTVAVKIRDASFQTVSRSRSMPAATSGTMTIYRLARALFASWRQQHPRTAVRLLGVGASGLEDAAALHQEDGVGLQLDTLAVPEQKLDSVLDAINQRYGDAKIAHGLTLRRGSSAAQDDEEQQGRPMRPVKGTDP